LEALPNRSVRVPVITPARLDDVLRARLLVEGSAVELAVHRFTAADRERLAENLARHDAAIHERRAGDVAEETRHNYAFHFLIYRAAASPVLLSIIESLWLQSGPILAAATQAFAASDELSGTKYHHALAAAIAVGDVAAARAALAADIGRAFDILRTQFAEGAGP
jgi:DNA-binding GntR family transcriptional regulator